jgi:hypothetical protein
MSLARQFEHDVRAQFDRQPLPNSLLLGEQHLTRVPPQVATYLRRTGALGKPLIHNFRVTFGATMYRTPDQPMESTAVQYEFVDHPARYFFLRTRMLGLPVRVLHDYADGQAHMQVRVAGLVNLVNLRGRTLSRAETVTVLNDLCIMAPTALTDRRLHWEALDALRVRVAFRRGEHQISAVLCFDEAGDLVNFESDDRHAQDTDGERWTTPLRRFETFEGRRIAAEGDAIWHYADGHHFKYGTFRIREIRWNVPGFAP